MMGSGMRASTPRRAAFLTRVSPATGTAEEKRLHAVNWTLKTCLQPYPCSFRASSTLQPDSAAIRAPAGEFGFRRASADWRQSINCGANYAFAEATDK